MKVSWPSSRDVGSLLATAAAVSLVSIACRDGEWWRYLAATTAVIVSIAYESHQGILHGREMYKLGVRNGRIGLDHEDDL